MNLSLILQLLTGAPLEIAQVAAIWATVKGAFAARDQAAIDKIIATMDNKTDADVARLHTDAGGAAAG